MNRFNHEHVEGTLVTTPIIKRGNVAHFVEFRIRAHDDSTDTSFGSKMRKDCTLTVSLYVHDSRFDRSDYENMAEGAEATCDYWVDSTEYRGRRYTNLHANEITVAGSTYPKAKTAVMRQRESSQSSWNDDDYWDDLRETGIDYDFVPDDELGDLADDDRGAWNAGVERGLW